MVPVTWGANDSSGNTCSWADHGGDNFDALTGVTLGTGSGYTSLNYKDTTESYDAAGRSSISSQQYAYTATCGDTQCDSSGTGQQTKQYDAEDHLVGQSYATWQADGTSLTCPSDWSGGNPKGNRVITASLSYKWGPNGHVVQTGNTMTSQTMQYETLHWDGDSVLFTTNSAGALDDIKLGADADIWLNGGAWIVQYQNRDFSGAIGDDQNPPSPNRQLCASYTQPPIWQPALDGITDGYNIFQGVRTYDPVLGTWTTPDAYEGDARDPMSQHAYMWNDNNPVAYSDPTGYSALAIAAGIALCAGGGCEAAAVIALGVIAVGGTVYVAVKIAQYRKRSQQPATSSENSGREQSAPAGEAEGEREATPSTDPGQFKPVRGSNAKENKQTGEIFVPDMLHKDHYEVYKNKKLLEKSKRSRAVWNDGRPKPLKQP